MKHLKHCETLWNSHHLMRRYRRSMWRRLRLGQRRRRSRGGHSMRRYRRSMRRRRRSMLRHWRSARWRRRSRGVTSDIGDCGDGITPQMCNRVTNHGDMSTFSKPAPGGQWITFLPFSQKILLNIKNVEYDFRMGCIHVLLPFLWIINLQCTNFRFLNFLFSKLAILAYFDPKLSFLSLKFL